MYPLRRFAKINIIIIIPAEGCPSLDTADPRLARPAAPTLSALRVTFEMISLRQKHRLYTLDVFFVKIIISFLN